MSTGVHFMELTKPNGESMTVVFRGSARVEPDSSGVVVITEDGREMTWPAWLGSLKNVTDGR